jgi:hypothetical protein
MVTGFDDVAVALGCVLALLALGVFEDPHADITSAAAPSAAPTLTA